MRAAFLIGFLVYCAIASVWLGSELVETLRKRKQRRVIYGSASARIHNLTDDAMRRMLEESLRSMSNQRTQGPTR